MVVNVLKTSTFSAATNSCQTTLERGGKLDTNACNANGRNSELNALWNLRENFDKR